jgi:hypothetical protein
MNGISMIRIAATLALLSTSTFSNAQCCPPQVIHYEQARQLYGVRYYFGYPYQWSVGPRYDPYWSYNSSYFPETYHGDGSYYGLGYSGYGGRGGGYGGWWYW